jgi:hypothetical protein
MAEQIEHAVTKPLRYALTLYPDCPMKWMTSSVSEDRDASLEAVRQAIQRLFAGKAPYSAFCRALPLNRFFAHNKVHIFSNLTETIEAIKNYPHGDKERAETFARSVHNMTFMQRAKDDPETFARARSFWNLNLTLAQCAL